VSLSGNVDALAARVATEFNTVRKEQPALFNVRAYGAVGDGATDDSGAIQDAIDACVSAGGGTVWFPRGDYVVGTGLVVDGSGVVLQGEGRGASRLLKGDDIELLRFTGSAGEGNHIEDCGLLNLSLRGEDYSGRLLNTTYVTRFYARDLHLFGNDGTGLDMAEVWDSRFENVYVEWCGNATLPAVWVRSSQASSGDGTSTDATNQVLFKGLLVEGWRAGAIVVEQGPGSPESIYGIHFYGTKVETWMVRDSAIVIGDGTSNVTMTDTYVYMDGFDDGYSTPVPAVALGGWHLNRLDGLYIGVGDQVVTAGVEVTGGGVSLNNVEGNYGGGAPTSGYHIYVDGAEDVTFSQLTVWNADVINDWTGYVAQLDGQGYLDAFALRPQPFLFQRFPSASGTLTVSADSNIKEVVLSGNVSVNLPTGWWERQVIRFEFYNPSGSAKTVTFNSNYKVSSGITRGPHSVAVGESLFAAIEYSYRQEKWVITALTLSAA